MSPPAERVWTVNTYYVDDANQYVPDPNALTTALLEIVGLLNRVGGVVQMATRRAEIAPGRVETLAVVFRWRSFVPLDKTQEAPPVEQDGTAEQAQAAPLPQPVDLPAEDEPIEVPAEQPAAA